MASKKKNYLKHPIKGEGVSDLSVAKNVMAMSNNGGWEWIDPPKAEENGKAARVQGEDGKSKKSPRNTESDSPRAKG